MKHDSRTMEVANFICRFGEHAVLIDFLQEIVAPVFIDDSHNRAFDDTSYFFYNVCILHLPAEGGTSVTVVAGRFIKDTNLKREQVFKKGTGLVADKAQLASSPSSIFALILDNHRLLYLKETADGPSLASFRSTTLSFLKSSRRNYLRASFAAYKAQRKADQSLEKLTIKDFSARVPQPTLEIIPLASETSIEEFIKQFEMLKKLQITLIKPNHEQDNNDFFVQWREKQSQLNSSSSALVYANTKEGLDKQHAVDEIAKVAGVGNHKVTLRGVDESGDILTGNNDKFSLKVGLGAVSRDVPAVTKTMYGAFVTLVGNGLVKIEETKAEVSDKLKHFFKSLPRRQ